MEWQFGAGRGSRGRSHEQGQEAKRASRCVLRYRRDAGGPAVAGAAIFCKVAIPQSNSLEELFVVAGAGSAVGISGNPNHATCEQNVFAGSERRRFQRKLSA